MTCYRSWKLSKNGAEHEYIHRNKLAHAFWRGEENTDQKRRFKKNMDKIKPI